MNREASSPETDVEAHKWPLRILLVDDDDSLREPLKRFLEAAVGCCIDAVVDGPGALAQVEVARGRYDVALIDEVLPAPLSGIDIVRKIKGTHPDIECIVFTGWGLGSKDEVLRAGALRYLEKPFDRNELAVLIRIAAQQRRLRLLARSILSETRLDVVLDQAKEAAWSLSLADEAAIVLLDPVTGKLAIHETKHRNPFAFRALFKEPGLTREIMDSARSERVLDAPNDERVNPVLVDSGIKAFIGVPIPSQGENIGVLYVFSSTHGRLDEWNTLTTLQLFAGQVGLAIANARAFKEIESHAFQMRALVDTSRTLATPTVSEKELLETVWTFVQEQLEAKTFFVALHDPGKDVLRFPLAYEDGAQIDVPERVLGTDASQWGLAGYVVKSGQELSWRTREEAREKQTQYHVEPIQKGAPCSSCFITALRTGDTVIGAISIQSDKPNVFTSTVLNTCRALGHLLAVALQSARLIQQIEDEQTYVSSIHEASKVLVSATDPEQLWHDVADQAMRAADARRAVVVWLSRDGQAQVAGHAGAPLAATHAARPTGVSRQVMNAREARFYSDALSVPELNPAMKDPWLRSTACLPLCVDDRATRVLWLDFDETQAFSETKRHSLQRFADHSALAFVTARRLRQLDLHNQVTTRLAAMDDPKSILQGIVEGACEILESDSAVIWPYDQAQRAFLPGVPIAAGIEQEKLVKYRMGQPRPGGTAEYVMAHEYVAIPDVADAAYEFLKETHPGLRRDLGVKAFEGIALRAGGPEEQENLGVLYVNYRTGRTFTAQDRDSLARFARDAALVLRKARLRAQLEQTRDAALVVSQATTRGNLGSTLSTVSERVRDSFQADVVVILSYDERRAKFGQWAFARSERASVDPETLPARLSSDEFIYRLIHLDKPPYFRGDDDAEHLAKLFGCKGNSDAAFQTMLGVQLRVDQHVAGVMLVGCCSWRRYLDSEIDTIQLFADQAAVAIRNGQLNAEAELRAEELTALYEAGTLVTRGLDLGDVMPHLAKQAFELAKLMGSGRDPFFSTIVLVDDREIHIAATYPPELQPRVCSKIRESEQRGIVGRTIATGEAQRVPDVSKDVDYVQVNGKTQSELAVPILMQGQVLGVIDIEYIECDGAERADEEMLSLLATQAANAIQNSRQYEALREIKALVGSKTAVEWMRMVSAGLQHRIEGVAGRGLDAVYMLRKDLEAGKPRAELEQRLDQLKGAITDLRHTPLADVLSEDRVGPVQVNQLIEKHLKRTWDHEPYGAVELTLDLEETLDRLAVVRASQVWLRRLVSILVDNSVEAMVAAESPRKNVTVSTRLVEGRGVEIRVVDTGPGIPEERRDLLFTARIEKPAGEPGAGVGLLEAQAIVRMYGGTIERVEPGPEVGTEMLVVLPAYEATTEQEASSA